MCLARGRCDFAAAGLASALLEEEAIPVREAFAIGDRLCHTALAALDPLLGTELINAHGEGTRKRDFDVLIPVAQTELALASPEGVDRVADSMITLAAATELWSAYGGDGGGW